jgi:1-phosphatidylinositol phosphodiesterase
MSTQNWMGNVPGNVYLSQLSIPGTHDTLTFSATAVAEDQDPSFDIATQLNAGIRYFDLRLVMTQGAGSPGPDS